ADLMAEGAADFELEQRSFAHDALHSVARDLVPSIARPITGFEYANALGVRRIGREGARNLPGFGKARRGHDGQVALLKLFTLERLIQARESFRAACGQHQARSL